MIRISLPYLFSLANALEPLASIQTGDARFETGVKVWGATAQLHGFLNSSVYGPAIRSSRALGEQLLDVLNSFKADAFDNPIEAMEAFQLKNTYSHYKIALLAELGIAPTYFVTPKPPFDTAMLLELGECLLPVELAQKAPEAVFDAREAGKCLAYELGTAAGFHILRAAECVVRRYYADVTGGAAQPKVRNLMVYVRQMQYADVGDAKVLSSLEQIAKLHRNPLIHPEDVLTVSEAMALIGIVRSAVSSMLAVLPDVPLTTSTASGLHATPQVSLP
jgi:hypothetical protein